MKVWAIADLHLSFSTPAKSMEVFGAIWKDYTNKIYAKWHEKIAPEDLVLIPGDISWASTPEEALVDLKWIDSLPGTKVILKGNHDYWWPSSKKLAALLPKSIHFIYNNALQFGDIAIGGSRLWDTLEYSFTAYIEFKPNALTTLPTESTHEQDEKIFIRELERLKLSLRQLSSSAKVRIAMTHYPPIGPDLASSRSSEILEEYKIEHCLFGHLHSVKKNSLPFGSARGVNYALTSCDYLDFTPLQVL